MTSIARGQDVTKKGYSCSMTLEMGQKQTSRHVQPMSALPPKADIDGGQVDVRFGSKADIERPRLNAWYWQNLCRSSHPSGTATCPLCAKSGHHALYSITSSAAFNRPCGTVSLSALAVLRFITNSVLTDCWIGRSPGFSPLRMRPV